MVRQQFKLACIGLLLVMGASAEDFSLQFASPVAAQSYQMKRSAFVFRTLGCSSDVKAEVNATAEGLVYGQRRSMVLKLVGATGANVFGISPEWPDEGLWVVSIKARCGTKFAGALVATNGRALVRETSTVLDHAPTTAEIESALKGGKKPEGRID